MKTTNDGMASKSTYKSICIRTYCVLCKTMDKKHEK